MVGFSPNRAVEITLGLSHLVCPTRRAETSKQDDSPEHHIDDQAATAFPLRSILSAAPPLVLVRPLTGDPGCQPETAEPAKLTGNRDAQRSEMIILRLSRPTAG